MSFACRVFIECESWWSFLWTAGGNREGGRKREVRKDRLYRSTQHQSVDITDSIKVVY